VSFEAISKQQIISKSVATLLLIGIESKSLLRTLILQSFLQQILFDLGVNCCKNYETIAACY
jgi:hypothetical protein